MTCWFKIIVFPTCSADSSWEKVWQEVVVDSTSKYLFGSLHTCTGKALQSIFNPNRFCKNKLPFFFLHKTDGKITFFTCSQTCWHWPIKIVLSKQIILMHHNEAIIFLPLVDTWQKIILNCSTSLCFRHWKDRCLYQHYCMFLISSLSSFQYHVEHNRAHFYVDDSPTATAIHKCSHKITDSDGYKVCWFFDILT